MDLTNNKIMEVSGFNFREDDRLSLTEDPERWIQENPIGCLSIYRLELNLGVDVETLGDSIGDLSELLQLSVRGEVLKRLPKSISKLSKLQRLELHHCYQLQELPESLGELQSVKELFLIRCINIVSLPNSFTKLSTLLTLHLENCTSLFELPAISVVNLRLIDCWRIQFLSEGMHSLCLLRLPVYSCSHQKLANFFDNINLWYLTIGDFSSNTCQFQELFQSLDKLRNLLMLDIQHTNIRRLPLSITELPKLRLLLLPRYFRVETLPFYLNDSVIISVLGKHVRKTWKQLKDEMQLFSKSKDLGVGHNRYLLLREEGPGRWIWEDFDCTPHSTVQILELVFDEENVEVVTDSSLLVRTLLPLTVSIRELAEFTTHLYISRAAYVNHLPQTFTRIKHVSLSENNSECSNDDSFFDNLGKLSTLESLELQNFGTFPANINLPIHLRCLTLRDVNLEPLLDAMTKLSSLKILELFGCRLKSLPANMNLAKLKLVNSNIESPPINLKHLEILHESCGMDCYDGLQVLLNQLVNMETLSVTCYKIEFLPWVVGQRLHNLHILELKDCFSLKELPWNLGALKKLSFLNLSGTRIQSLPHRITEINNLQCLILPKCFTLVMLPWDFEQKCRISIDDTDDKYYEEKGYSDFKNSSNYTNESDKQSVDGIEAQHSPNDNNLQSEDRKEKRKMKQRIDIPFKNISSLIAANITLEDAAKMLCVSRATLKRRCREFGITEWPFRKNKEIKTSFKKKIPQLNKVTPQVNHGFNNGNVGDINQHILSTSAASACEAFDDSTQYANPESSQDYNVATRSVVRVHEVPEEVLHSNNHNTSEVFLNEKNTQVEKIMQTTSKKLKKEISLETIDALKNARLTLHEASKRFGVSRSTLKRRLRELGMKWPSVRKRNTGSTVLSELQQFNMVEHTNSAEYDHGMVPLGCVAIDNITQNADPSAVSTHSQTVGHELRSDVNVSTLPFDAQEGSSSRLIVTKASYEGDTVKFKISSSACINELKEEVARNLEIELGKFKIFYHDEDNELMLLTTNEHLQDALRVSREHCKSDLRLQVKKKI